MKAPLSETQVVSAFREEVSAIAGHYGVSPKRVFSVVEPVEAQFELYWEMVFSSEGFELITAGKGSELRRNLKAVALHHGLSPDTVGLFEACSEVYPDVIIGIKLPFSQVVSDAPTVYVRTKAPKESVLGFLGSRLTKDAINGLEKVLVQNKTVYGLGFSEKDGRLYLKTYTIENVTTANGHIGEGFVSHRLSGRTISKEHKEYVPDVPLSEYRTDNARLKTLRDFLVNEMGYTHAGHIGALYENDAFSDYKIYVERTGGIPTDYAAK